MELSKRSIIDFLDYLITQVFRTKLLRQEN